MRVLVVGLDGACLPVLDRMSALGVTPHLDAIRRQGNVSSLESQLPPWTPSAWPSMYTGVNPGKHGVFDFLRFDGYEWEVVNRSHVNENAIWELLSREGFSSVVLNVPVTHPPRDFDGALVPGYIAPERPTCHPIGLWSDLQDAVEGYSVYGKTLDSTAPDDVLERELVDLAHTRGEAFRYLTDRFEPDFGFVQFQATDTVFHQFPDDPSVAQRVYHAVDREIEQIRGAANADLTLVVSDHGIGRMDGHEFRVNNFLRDEGYLTTTSSGGGMPSWKSITRDDPAADGESDLVHTVASTGVELAARAGVTSQRIGWLLERMGLKEQVLETVPVDVIRAGTEQVDFPISAAYMRTRTEMGVRLNLEGREPTGTVARSAYDDVRSELIDRLAAVTTPAGDPVFERVAPREEIFDGPYVDDAPDIVTVPNRFDQFLVANLKDGQFGPPTEPFEHKRYGLLMATGDGIAPNAELAGAHLFDIAPTILAWFGLPVSDRMDGEPLPLIEEFTTGSYPAFEPATVGTDSDAVAERLSDLGYLQ